MKELFEKLNEYSTVYVYGAGYVAIVFYNWFAQNGGDVKKLFFLVSAGDNPEIGGIPVSEIGKIEIKTNAICVVAIRDVNAQEVVKRRIGEYNFSETIFLNEDLYRALFSFDPSFSFDIENSKRIEAKVDQIREIIEQFIARNDEQHLYISNQTEMIHKIVKDTEDYLIRKMIRATLNFEVQVAEHCNLNCAGCDHFSPIAEKSYLDIEKYTKDIKQLALITNGNVGHIKLLGGEPLLHPEIERIIELTRNSFVNAYIEVVSNGILVNSMPESFWEKCRTSNIDITVTKYPINIDFEKMTNLAKEKGVTLRFISEDVEKTLWKLPIDEEGKQDPSINFYKCWRINNCISLVDGKIYSCVIPAHINHFNKAFSKNIPVTENDYVDIYKVKSVYDILEFCSRPLSFCRYCNVCGETNGHPWSVSTKSKDEWV